MGFNLGAFAGGVATGYQSQQKLQLAQEEQRQNAEFKNRQLKMQESDQARQEADWKRQDELRAQTAEIFKKHGYGPDREEVEGYDVSDDGMGNVVQMPRKKVIKGKQPGLPGNEASDIALYSDLAAAHMKYNSDPKEYMAFAERAKQLAADGKGRKVLDGLTSGDPKKWADMISEFGGKPTEAHFDPDTFQLTIAKGAKPINIINYLALAGAHKDADTLNKIRESGDKSALTKSQIAENTAQTEQLIPAQAYQHRQSGNLAGAKMKALAEGGTGGTKVDKALNTRLEKAALDPNTGKVDSSAYGFFLDQVAGEKDPSAALGAAQSRYKQIVTQADSIMKAAGKGGLAEVAAGLKAKGITVDPGNAEAVRQGLLQAGANRFRKNSTAPTVQDSSNLRNSILTEQN